MMIADGIGIIIGIVLGKKIPERVVKWVAAIIFILFGLFGLYESVLKSLLTMPLMAGTLLMVIVSIYFVSRMGGEEEIEPSTDNN
jgi:small basic protein